MKTVVSPALPRCGRIQDVLRAFAAGSGPTVKEPLRYLRWPAWHPRADGKVWTVAGDGRAFIWAGRRVKGFADYVMPSPGMGYFDLPSVWGLWRPAGSFDFAPAPCGAWGSGMADTIYLAQCPAVVRRYDLARLQLLDRCMLGLGQEWRDAAGRVVGWKSVSFEGNFDGVTVRGVVFCDPPPAIRLEKKRATAAKTRLKRASK